MSAENSAAWDRVQERMTSFGNDGDWQHIFEEYAQYPVDVRTRQPLGAHYHQKHVVEIVAAVDGENDGADWVGLFWMQDGHFLTLRAGCDYTGWGCRESGSADVADSLPDAIAFGLTREERTRLAAQLNARVPARVAS